MDLKFENFDFVIIIIISLALFKPLHSFLLDLFHSIKLLSFSMESKSFGNFSSLRFSNFFRQIFEMVDSLLRSLCLCFKSFGPSSYLPTILKEVSSWAKCGMNEAPGMPATLRTEPSGLALRNLSSLNSQSNVSIRT